MLIAKEVDVNITIALKMQYRVVVEGVSSMTVKLLPAQEEDATFYIASIRNARAVGVLMLVARGATTLVSSSHCQKSS